MKLSAIFTYVLIGLAIFITASSAKADDANIDSPNGQAILDFLAKFPVPEKAENPGAAYAPPGPFSSWSLEDQKSVPGKLAFACEMVWVMSHDAPGTHFLPLKQDREDEEKLGSYVCLAGHMPPDWPLRTEILSSTKAILARAKALGSSLNLPPNLSPLQ